MFSIPGLLGLLVLTYIRPQAFVPQLRGVPLIHLVYIAALAGFAIDLRTRLLRAQTPPLMWWSAAYFVWSIVTVGITMPVLVPSTISLVLIRFLIFFMTVHAVQSFRALRAAVVCVLVIAGFLAAAGIYQGTADKGCIQLKTNEAGTYDGRTCDTHDSCYHEGEPGALYRCEHVGLFGTTSINGRVRWLGIIEDPNELAMCLSLCAPLLIGLFLLRPGFRNGALLVLGLAAFMWCVVYTESRGGQLVFLAALGAYFVRRFRLRGVIVMALFAVPLLALGGRAGAEADQSKMERIEALYTAMTLLRHSPIVGVGFTRFLDYNVLTAHNSYALAAAETGLPGLFLFLAVLYQSMKSFIQVASRTQNEGPTRPAYVWAGALLAAQAGLMVGIFFLSFNESPILWTFLGLFGGFQLAARRHDPSFDFSLRGRDLLAIGALTIVLPQLLYVYTRLKVGAGGG